MVMNEKLEGIFQSIMDSSNHEYMMGQALHLAVELLEGLADDGGSLFDGIADDFEKKRIIALFSKMVGNISVFLNDCQDGLEADVERLGKRLSAAEQDAARLNEKKQELAWQLGRLRADHQELLSEGQNLRRQARQFDFLQARQQELLEEEQNVCGEDGRAAEHSRERQKKCQNCIDSLQKEESYQNMQLLVLARFSVRETDNQMLSNLVQVQQELAGLDQAGLDKEEVIGSTLKKLQEDEAVYEESAREAEKIREQFEVYKSSWGEESDFMAGLYERDLETPDKLRRYAADMQVATQAGLQEYDRLLGELVAQGEEERDLIERRQDKR